MMEAEVRVIWDQQPRNAGSLSTLEKARKGILPLSLQKEPVLLTHVRLLTSTDAR